jgi:hypothetical protein
MASSGRSPQPASNLHCARREDRPKRGGVGLNSPPCRAVVWQHQESGHRPGAPASFHRQLGRQASLPIETRQHGLQVWNDRFDLDDEQRARAGMKREEIDRAALSANVEGNLCRDSPMEPGKHRDDMLNQLGVARVQESVEPLALPEQANVDTRAKLGGDAVERVDRDPIGSSSLDPRDDGSRYPCADAQVRLGPLTAMSERAHSEPISDDIHDASVALADALPRICRLCRQGNPNEQGAGGEPCCCDHVPHRDDDLASGGENQPSPDEQRPSD